MAIYLWLPWLVWIMALAGSPARAAPDQRAKTVPWLPPTSFWDGAGPRRVERA